jgi:hypothetical protein
MNGMKKFIDYGRREQQLNMAFGNLPCYWMVTKSKE